MNQTALGHSANGAADRRSKRLPPVPVNYESLLNDAQCVGIRNLEGFGWQLYFIRRPLFQTPTVVMVGPDEGGYAVLNSEGCLDRQRDLVIR
ncbi:hypothetical protein NCG89_07450 [Spongiibacter taiwanensis]|uniref:hypothetical protein n=1 Tax=Spongiibacter taiwanensis TaxID=1748242 RepID=UPI00203596E9|nr:hypothetical protein [Spongiibacter taiwanensis]USA44601.1 hypothetical protein NCG89_07450 [Spongiibacter taiwanensis]